MYAKNVLLDKSVDFAVKIVRLGQELVNQKEFVISKQITRSGTSIGANAHEAVHGSSKADFIAKLFIALKEAAETEYWLQILIKSELIDKNMGESMINDCVELKRIIIATINTVRNNER